MHVTISRQHKLDEIRAYGQVVAALAAEYLGSAPPREDTP